MKAYNETRLCNEYAQDVAERLYKEGVLSKEQWDRIKEAYADLSYNPNVFIKLLLFIFGCVGFGMGSSMMAIFVMGTSFLGFAIISAIYAIGAFFMLRFLIKDRKFYFSGIDNALIYCILGAFVPLLYQIYDTAQLQEIWMAILLFLPLLLAATYIFGEPLVALGTFLSGLFIIASLLLKNPIGKALLPFALMICAGITYWLLHKFSQKQTAFYWKIAIEWVSTAALVLFYVAGNYYVVREANAALNNLSSPAPEIAFAGVFWFLTFVVPLLYWYLGFRWRDRLLLLLGLLGVVASVLTFRFYHAVLPTEWGMVLGGLVATAVAVFVTQYLKTPKHGFSNFPDTAENDTLGIQTVVLSQMTQNIQSADHGLKLGGGDFGGGGAGEEY